MARRRGPRCALALVLRRSPWVEILLGLQTFPKSVLYRHDWILPDAGLVLAPVMLCFLHARSFMFLLPRTP